jgi:hypothetical protein
MKQIYFLLVSCTLLLAGCSQINPVMPESKNTEKTWILISKAAGSSTENSLFSSARINGNVGGELLLQGSYPIDPSISFDSRLVVPADAYSGLRTLTEETGTGAYVDFGPSMNFNLPLILDLSISGLDLTGIEPGQINFYYMAPDGSFELTQNDGIYVHKESGTLKVFKARINHFSRYGWAK